MIDILKKLNKDKDRCALIGRNALNMSFSHKPESINPFYTTDYDIVCPDLKMAQECSEILRQSGFVNDGATFAESKRGELDILIADPEYPRGVIAEYYNVPSLRPLWDSRVRENGIPVSDNETLIMNKLLYARENDGKDLKTVAIYFTLEPDRLEPFIERIKNHDERDERETMLYSLYASMADKEDVKKKIEEIILSEIENPEESVELNKDMKNEDTRAGETPTPVSGTRENREEVGERDRRITELDDRLNRPPYRIGSAGYPEREAAADVDELLKLEVMKLRDESDVQIGHQDALKKATERHPVVIDVRQILEHSRGMTR
jgi:rubrerythrin